MATRIKKLSNIELAFCESYLVCLNKAKAAIDAGISEHTAKQQGYQIYNRTNVKAYIEKVLAERVLSAAETSKLISDTAQGNMSDYMHTVQRLDIPKIKKGLQQIIDHLKYEIEIETEFLRLAPKLSKEERERSEMFIRSHELEITRYEIELNKNPNACRIVDGDAVLVDEVVLDLHAIVADKERGKIKSYKMTKDGVQIEMYPADAAADRLAKMHGLYKEDNKQKAIMLPTSIHMTLVPPVEE